MSLTETDYKYVRDACNYGAATSMRAAARRLTSFRDKIISDGSVNISTQTENMNVNNTATFDKWVAENFPDLTETLIYPSVSD